MHTRAILFAFVVLTVFALSVSPPPDHARADEGWDITAVDVLYVINTDGTVDVTEDIRVDFGALERHGIIRVLPVEYEYDDENNRLMDVVNVSADDGTNPHIVEVSDAGSNIEIRLGDPEVFVSGLQRYRIRYTINDGLNPFPDHDEFYWNVTGTDWAVPIDGASAQVVVPAPGIERVECFEGPFGSSTRCTFSTTDALEARFASGPLPEGSNLTVVIGLEKGLVTVGPPVLVDADESVGEQVSDFLGLHPWTIAATFILGIALLAAVIRQWWIAGRDRWYGDMAHATDGTKASRKPLFAHETIVTQYTPPDVDGAAGGRRLRPAEIGLLVDERADTLDVSATIVDLAVRGYLVIKENESGGVFGLFKSKDYELERAWSTKPNGLLPYEQKLLDSLFESGSLVNLSDLKNKFHDDLEKVKEYLYKDVTTDLRFFPRDPDTTRTIYRVAGGVIAAIGAGLVYLLGMAGVAILGVPIVLAGVLLFLLAPTMPRRTPEGREAYRRALGFRRYIETAETERQRFAERANIFEEYLPYAIVFECIDKWANAFEGLEAQAQQPSWYRGRGPFVASAFVSNVNEFSSSISSVMASTPGGRGGSGFGGGGFSGGGGGGGGGRSW